MLGAGDTIRVVERPDCPSVEMRTLERLPSLSWQQQLPPLQVPLAAIPGRSRGAGVAEEESQHQ
jgi:hypothetical protein